MEAYKVKIYPSARRDLEEIIEYLNTLSKDAALRYYDELVKEISSLTHMPERYPHPRDIALAAKGYRFFSVKNYLVFYVIIDNIVQIRRILYSRRNYSHLL